MRLQVNVKNTADFFKVLAEAPRLQMLWLLFNHRELCVCDFVVALEITQSKASRHLRTLWHGGLVTDRRDGLWIYYSLRPLESELPRPYLELLRKTLASCPEAPIVLERLKGWLDHGRTLPQPSKPLVQSRRAGRPEPPAARKVRAHRSNQPSRARQPRRSMTA